MNYNVYINGKKIDILKGTIFPPPYNETSTMEYAIFEMADSADILIESEVYITNAVIRPLSLGLDYKFDAHKIYINLNKPCNLSVEINGSHTNNILVFANPKRENKEIGSDRNVISFGKGEHKAGLITVNKDNTTFYFDEGAYVYGKLEIKGCKNITIFGCGVLSMENMPSDYKRCIDVIDCADVRIKDIVISDSTNWSLRVFGCDDVHIDNVKIIGHRGNSDGIDICGSRNVTVENCFTRVWDDSLVVKAFDTGDVNNVLFKNCVLWNDFARPIEVGVELRAEKVHNIRFENIDVIHSLTGYPVMGIHHGDRAEVSDIVFENIRIEDALGAQLFDIRITDSIWNKDNIKGFIRDIYFKNIFLVGNPGIDVLQSKSRLQGFSKESGISNANFENISLLGKLGTTVEECNIDVMENVENVSVKCSVEGEKVNLIKTSIEITEAFKLQQNGYYNGKVRISARNTAEFENEGSLWLQISPVNTAIYDTALFEFRLEKNQSAFKEYDILIPAGKYVLCVQSDNVNIKSAWQFVDLDWVVYETENVEDAFEYQFVNYFNVRSRGIKAAVWKDCLLLQSDIFQYEEGELVIYTATPVPAKTGEVAFTVEETDFGLGMALIHGKNGLESAPQLGCPAEITYVFKNEPKVKEIRINYLNHIKQGVISIPFEKLGLESGLKNFRIEIEKRIKEIAKFRYPYTLFHSVDPVHSSHMFANVYIK